MTRRSRNNPDEPTPAADALAGMPEGLSAKEQVQWLRAKFAPLTPEEEAAAQGLEAGAARLDALRATFTPRTQASADPKEPTRAVDPRKRAEELRARFAPRTTEKE
jgi:hypothetical protein